ncbi:Uncharacterised protein [Salmonella enterica subsp. enterica]|nr:Uncharacterised protein [Salmonella enterica subsp. enterica] [Salmonella enterica subsp. enterica serovar Menston]
MSFVKSLPILRNLFWMFGGVVYKNKQARRYGYACAGHARRDAKIRADYVWTAASVGGECECKTLADSEQSNLVNEIPIDFLAHVSAAQENCPSSGKKPVIKTGTVGNGC